MFQVQREVTVDAPIEEVWRVLADEYHEVGAWASSIAQSRENTDVPVVAGAQVGGRVCEVPGFGELRERLTRFDETNRVFSYEAYEGMPFFVKKAANVWTLEPRGNKTLVKMNLTGDVNFFPGRLMAPMMKRQFGKQASDVVEELKYFVEEGKPHPRKIKAMKQAA